MISSRTAMLASVAGLLTAFAAEPSSSVRPHCPGTRLVQDGERDKRAPAAKADRAPERGSRKPQRTPPGDDGDSDRAPRSGEDPPGCIFRKEPLDLIV